MHWFLFFFPLVVFAETFLVFGGQSGWIGQKIVFLLESQGHAVFTAEARLENREEVFQEIERVLPDCIINAAGKTGRPNVDWCENHQQETIRANVIGALNLADIAFLKGIHVTHFGTGCIYEYDEAHPIHSGIGFTEEDKPNFDGSFYSKSKGMLDGLLRSYPNVLQLRLRMPISSDFSERNLIVKLIGYQKVIDIPNSMTVLDDLLPVAIEMALRKRAGTYNFVNPGVISHNQILSLYRQYVDPSFKWENFTIEEQDLILKAKRSNNELNTDKLLQEFPDIPPIYEAVEKVMKKLGASISVQAR